jgi:hypothetical protein
MASNRPSGPRLVILVMAGLVGLVFLLQGLGAPIGNSFMIGDLRWSAIGIALIVTAAVIAWREVGPAR